MYLRYHKVGMHYHLDEGGGRGGFTYIRKSFRFIQEESGSPTILSFNMQAYHYIATNPPCDRVFYTYPQIQLLSTPYPIHQSNAPATAHPFALHDPHLSGSTLPHTCNCQRISTALTPPASSFLGGVLHPFQQ